MQRFRKLLYVHHPGPVETSGLWRAVELARRNDAAITVIDVIRELPGEMKTEVEGIDVPSLIVRERRDRLEALLEPVRAEGAPLTVEVRVGTPFVEIVRSVIRGGHDLVIKTARGGGLRQRLFGSTALHLMRKCPCPVWIVKPGARGSYRRILAAVDPIAGGEAETVDDTILQLAASLAAREQSELHVVHAWQAEESLRSGLLPRDFVARVTDQIRERHENKLRELLSSHQGEGPTPRVHFVRGNPEQVIVSKAEELGVDLIVLGTVCRTRVAGLFLGSTAEEVLDRVDCAVLTVKPKTFVSPVRLEERAALATH